VTATSVEAFLAAGRLQEAEWHMRRGAAAPLGLEQLAQRLGTGLDAHSFYVSPGYYAPLPSWVEAQRCCGAAYQAASVVERYQRAARQAHVQHVSPGPVGPYAMRQLAALQHAWLALGQPQNLRVLDFGGALGAHFEALVPYWPWGALHWTVCETPAVAAAGQAEFERDLPAGHRLRFAADAAAVLAGGVDVVLASCSLQYLEHWPALLAQFLAAPWLLLDRVPLVDHPHDLIAIQVVPASYTDTRYPGWKFAAGSWLPRLAQAGFEPLLHWLVPEDHWSILDLETGQYRWSARHDHGFLLRSQRSANGPASASVVF
jgi:putative methyltransferase (TIGR04325 family)